MSSPASMSDKGSDLDVFDGLAAKKSSRGASAPPPPPSNSAVAKKTLLGLPAPPGPPPLPGSRSSSTPPPPLHYLVVDRPPWARHLRRRCRRACRLHRLRRHRQRDRAASFRLRRRCRRRLRPVLHRRHPAFRAFLRHHRRRLLPGTSAWTKRPLRSPRKLGRSARPWWQGRPRRYRLGRRRRGDDRLRQDSGRSGALAPA